MNRPGCCLDPFVREVVYDYSAASFDLATETMGLPSVACDSRQSAPVHSLTAFGFGLFDLDDLWHCRKVPGRAELKVR